MGIGLGSSVFKPAGAGDKLQTHGLLSLIAPQSHLQEKTAIKIDLGNTDSDDNDIYMMCPNEGHFFSKFPLNRKDLGLFFNYY